MLILIFFTAVTSNLCLGSNILPRDYEAETAGSRLRYRQDFLPPAYDPIGAIMIICKRIVRRDEDLLQDLKGKCRKILDIDEPFSTTSLTTILLEMWSFKLDLPEAVDPEIFAGLPPMDAKLTPSATDHEIKFRSYGLGSNIMPRDYEAKTAGSLLRYRDDDVPQFEDDVPPTAEEISIIREICKRIVRRDEEFQPIKYAVFLEITAPYKCRYILDHEESITITMVKALLYEIWNLYLRQPGTIDPVNYDGIPFPDETFIPADKRDHGIRFRSFGLGSNILPRDYEAETAGSLLRYRQDDVRLTRGEISVMRELCRKIGERDEDFLQKIQHKCRSIFDHEESMTADRWKSLLYDVWSMFREHPGSIYSYNYDGIPFPDERFHKHDTPDEHKTVRYRSDGDGTITFPEEDDGKIRFPGEDDGKIKFPEEGL